MSFALDVTAYAKKAKSNAETVVRQTSFKLFSTIILESPVGEIDGGRFRYNWQAAGASPETGTLEGRDKQGNATVERMKGVIFGLKDWSEFTLANNLPYANVIEYGGYPGDGPNTTGGYSKQAPQGVVRVNVARFNTLLAEEAAKLK